MGVRQASGSRSVMDGGYLKGCVQETAYDGPLSYPARRALSIGANAAHAPIRSKVMETRIPESSKGMVR